MLPNPRPIRRGGLHATCPGFHLSPSNKATGWPLGMLAAKNRKAEQESTGTNEILRA